MLSSTTPCGGTWASASSGFDRLRPGLRRKEGRACAGKLGEQPTDVCVRVCVKGSRLHAPSRRNISARPKSRWCGGTRYYRMTPSRPATPGYETCAALGPYAARPVSSSTRGSAFSRESPLERSLSQVRAHHGARRLASSTPTRCITVIPPLGARSRMWPPTKWAPRGCAHARQWRIHHGWARMCLRRGFGRSARRSDYRGPILPVDTSP